MALHYNVHVTVDADHVEAWRAYMPPHIVDVLETGCFDGATFFEKEGTERAFVISYRTDAKRFATYGEKFADALKKDHSDKFGDHVVAYREILTTIGSFSPS